MCVLVVWNDYVVDFILLHKQHEFLCLYMFPPPPAPIMTAVFKLYYWDFQAEVLLVKETNRFVKIV